MKHKYTNEVVLITEQGVTLKDTGTTYTVFDWHLKTRSDRRRVRATARELLDNYLERAVNEGSGLRVRVELYAGGE